MSRADLLHAVSFTTNYHLDRPARAWEFGHLWSLAVEEQFYLLWPAVMFFVKPRGALFVALGTMVLAPAIRVISFKFFPESRAGIGETFQTVFDTLATGCVLALIRPRLDAWKRFTQIQSHVATPLAYLALALLIHRFHGRVSISYPIGETLTNVLLALVLDACVRAPNTLFGRFLELRPIAFIGVLSYSLYLAQQPFINRKSDAWVTAFPQNLVLTLVVAAASYYLVEKPFLNVRTMIQRRWLKPKKRTVATETVAAGPSQ